MALTIEDGTGLANADTYVTEVDFDSYAALYSYDLAGKTSAQKEVALRKATRYLDAKFSARWVGYRGTRTQALDWPRTGGEDATGWLIDDNEIPAELTKACNELAFLSIGGSVLLPDVAAGESGKTINRIKVGGIDVAETFSGDSESTPVWRMAHALLAPIMRERRLLRA